MPALPSAAFARCNSSVSLYVLYPRSVPRISAIASRETFSMSAISRLAFSGYFSTNFPASVDFTMINDSVCPRGAKYNEDTRALVEARQSDAERRHPSQQAISRPRRGPENGEVHCTEDEGRGYRDQPLCQARMVQYRLEEEEGQKHQPNIRCPPMLAVVR